MVYLLDKTRVGALDARDGVFDHFRKLYPKFDQWLLQVSHRDAYFVKDGENIVALMILKRESLYDVNSEIFPIIPRENHLKICSLRSIKEGEGLGSALLNKAIEVATAEHLPYVYFTLHKENQSDEIKRFFEKRGFEECGSTNDEVVYMKTISAIKSEPEPETETTESENKSSKVNWRNLLKEIGKLFIEVHLILWLVIWFNFGQQSDKLWVGLLGNYIGLVPIHFFLWEGITERLKKRAKEKQERMP